MMWSCLRKNTGASESIGGNMLQSLHIVNFAIIEDTIIELTDGATVFTGETGAGKSI